MTIEVSREPITVLPEYARISIAFTVDRVVDVARNDDPDGGFVVSERRIELPYVKDYDAIPGEGPLHWARRFDLSTWTIFTARASRWLVGAAAAVCDTPGLVVLWDIRVSPDARGRGVGSALFGEVETWARLQGCRQLKIETQNTNVDACRFYQRQGCRLRTINRGVYPDFPGETQLLWYKDLAAAPRIA